MRCLRIKNNKKIIVIFLIILLFFGFTVFVALNTDFDEEFYDNHIGLNLSGDTGWVSPQIMANILRSGRVCMWFDVDSAKTQNDDSACVEEMGGGYSDWLRATNFSMGVPSGSVIVGIEVRYDKYVNMPNTYTRDSSLKLRITIGQKGDDKATDDNWATTDTDTYTLYGGFDDLWGATWTLEQVNSEDFGVDLSCYDDIISRHSHVDHVQIKIYYAEGDEEDPPTWDTLTESDDPLELGQTEIININVYDASTISTVDIEFDSFNHSMSFISGNTYRYSIWTPTSIGIKTYQIHMIDEFGNINQTSDLTITVEDTINPVIDNIIESDDPLELTDTETIEVDITDESSMTWVYLEFEGSNHSMSLKSGITWEYTSWTPVSVGNYPYIIYANDTSGNIDFNSSGSITVKFDLTTPTWDTLIFETNPLELGNLFTVWINVYDNTNVSIVRIEIEGNNYTMINLYNDTWVYFNYQFESSGSYNYTIWMVDSFSNLNFTQGIIQVVSSPIIIMSVAIIFLLVGMMVYFYFKGKRSRDLFLIVLTINSFSTIIGFMAMTVIGFPFTPILQTFFIVFQTVLFMLITLEIFGQKKQER